MIKTVESYQAPKRSSSGTLALETPFTI